MFRWWQIKLIPPFFFSSVFWRLMSVSRHCHWMLCFNICPMMWDRSQPPRPLLKRCYFIVVRDRIANLSPNDHLLGIVTCNTHCRFINRCLFGRLPSVVSYCTRGVVFVMTIEMEVWRTTDAIWGVLRIRNTNARNKSGVLARAWFTAVC